MSVLRVARQKYRFDTADIAVHGRHGSLVDEVFRVSEAFDDRRRPARPSVFGKKPLSHRLDGYAVEPAEDLGHHLEALLEAKSVLFGGIIRHGDDDTTGENLRGAGDHFDMSVMNRVERTRANGKTHGSKLPGLASPGLVVPGNDSARRNFRHPL